MSLTTSKVNPVIKIRAACLSDADSIAFLLKDAFEEYRQMYTPAALEATTPRGDQIRERLNEGPIWIAVQDSVIVGSVSGVPMEDSFYIRSMAVSPAARNLGVARKLLQHVETYAVQKGFKALSLCTTPFLSGAIHLYERSGFHFVRQVQPDLFGTPLLKMIKRIN
ncbi:GNAT family N-acetyltransferase [bacterium]|nr:GNAT family N-acetyltransferase [bacterium]